MSDGDDDKYVESDSEQRDEGQQNVNKHSLTVWALWPAAGGVEKLREAEFIFFHDERKRMKDGEGAHQQQL